MIHGLSASRYYRGMRALLLCMMMSAMSLLDAQVPINNRYDPAMFFSVKGMNPFPRREPAQSWFMLDLMPFYQHSAGAKPGKGSSFQCCTPPPPFSNNTNINTASDTTPSDQDVTCCTQVCLPSCRQKKVPEGDVLGRWNMLGLLQGTVGAPCEYLTPECQPVMRSAQEQMGCLGFGFNDYFVDSTRSLGYYSIPVNYQKIGLRFAAGFNLFWGFGVSAMSGVARYKQIPCFIDKSCEAQLAGLCPCSGGTTPELGPELPEEPFDCDTVIQEVQRTLMSQEQLQKIMCEIGMDICPVYITSVEDTLFQLTWSSAFDYKNEDDSLVTTVLPYFSIGAWAPTGERQQQDVAFSLPLGGNGFWATTAEVGLNFEFPGTVTLGFGAGAAFYERKVQGCVRAPSNINQSGVYPWKTIIERKPGIVWNAHIDLASYDFIENLSFYFNFVYTKHEKDEIRILCNNCSTFDPYCPQIDCASCKITCTTDSYGHEVCTISPYCTPEVFGCPPLKPQQRFFPEKMEDESEWDSQVVLFGFDYEIVRQLTIGFAVQVPITGMRVYKTSTIMGSLQFNF